VLITGITGQDGSYLAELLLEKGYLEEAFSYADLDWRKHLEIDPKYYRPTEVDLLVGDATKAKKKLGWEARTRFNSLVRLMMDADLSLAEKEAYMSHYNISEVQSTAKEGFRDYSLKHSALR
jgi:GDP-D-mannose dehydratase